MNGHPHCGNQKSVKLQLNVLDWLDPKRGVQDEVHTPRGQGFPTAPRADVQGEASNLVAERGTEMPVTAASVVIGPQATTSGSAEVAPPPPVTERGSSSVGSVGHPLACAEACKYARKTRGCKDGAACSRCHYCEWNRRSTKRVADKKFCT